MKAILGLGVVDLALGILLLAPLALGLRKNEYLSKALYLAFQSTTAVGMGALVLAGALLLTV